ncbi:MAG: hypothetical protein WBP13_02220 [Methylophilaceae bacterium]
MTEQNFLPSSRLVILVVRGITYGDHDWSTLQERQRTAKELGDTRVITIENTGHLY